MFRFIMVALLSSACVLEAVAVNNAKYAALDGETAEGGNPVDQRGYVVKINKPVLRLAPASAAEAKGTILLFPGGGYGILAMNHEGTLVAKFLNDQGFDVAILEYHVAAGPKTRDMALQDALAAYRLIRKDGPKLGVNSKRVGIMGFSAGGHLAARTASLLGSKEQPDDLILIYPAYLQETANSTRIMTVRPPANPSGRLFALIAVNDVADWVASCREYCAVWKETGGEAVLHVLPDGGHGFGMKTELPGAAKQWPDMLAKFLAAAPVPEQQPNPAAVPSSLSNWWVQRRADKKALIGRGKYDLIMIGDSITHNFEKPEYQAVWKQYFEPRHALNLGFSGARTEDILAMIQADLTGQTPRVITLMLGTNNADAKNYKTHHTGVQIAGGIAAVVKALQEKCPGAKILLLRCFPGAYGGPGPTSHRVALDQASEIAMKLADNTKVFFCDVNHVFLNLDGSIKNQLMPDWLHPNPEGARLWAESMEPTLSKLMGDASRCTNKPSNTAVIPVPKLENDSYDWWARHAQILAQKDVINPEIVLIGDSITHFWGGEPKASHANGPGAFDRAFAGTRVLNMGFGWDRTQNVLWRLDNGELDGLHPRTVIIHIGTNNTSDTPNARKNTAAEIVEGIDAICGRVRSKVPGVKIVLMQIFPREEKPDHPRRKLIDETNILLLEYGRKNKLEVIDLAPKMLNSQGVLSRELMPDFCHPGEKGYAIWADALRTAGVVE